MTKTRFHAYIAIAFAIISTILGFMLSEQEMLAYILIGLGIALMLNGLYNISPKKGKLK